MGDELVIVGRRAGRRDGELHEIARHELSTPGVPRIVDEHYPHHPAGNGPRTPVPKPSSEAEVAFCSIGEGARRWLVEAAATGAHRIRAKMDAAVEVSALVGVERVEEALGLAAVAGRFDDGDLASILDHLACGRPGLDLIRPDEAHSAQPGTAAWKGFGR